MPWPTTSSTRATTQFTHELVDIETLNRRAFEGDARTDGRQHPRLRVLARQIRAVYVRREHGRRLRADGRCRKQMSIDELRELSHCGAGQAYERVSCRCDLCLNADFTCVEVPFDQIIPAVVAGEYNGQPIDAGLIIHEGQLTYGDHHLNLIVDLGQWWKDRTGLPLPLGANVVRKNLGTETIREVQRLLKESIEYGLDHREQALHYCAEIRSRSERRAGRSSSSACT